MPFTGTDDASGCSYKRSLLISLKLKRNRGDTLLPPRLAGLFQVVSEPYRDTKRIFKGRIYPNRVRLKEVLIPEEPVEFKPLVPKLKFIRNKQFWAAHLRSGLAKITERDFKLASARSSMIPLSSSALHFLIRSFSACVNASFLLLNMPFLTSFSTSLANFLSNLMLT